MQQHYHKRAEKHGATAWKKEPLVGWLVSRWCHRKTECAQSKWQGWSGEMAERAGRGGSGLSGLKPFSTRSDFTAGSDIIVKPKPAAFLVMQ